MPFNRNLSAKLQNRLSRLEGYILIPHELLHVWGYRLVGKSCHYQWGDCAVRPLGPLTRRERLVGLLFPYVIFATGFLMCAGASGLAYGLVLQGRALGWFIFWSGLALLMGIYAGTTITDLRQAYLLIYDKPWYGWTPFDLFFWPFVDWEAIRKRELEKHNHEQAS